ncbi:PEP-CTERM sorting domain-containing protein [Phormidium sp. LEGE 05292]|uniref:PEP-CTERM sorting domain-containing protein n=1 Tax=[Phormidium] sp. LEGE 05292 TaxID=767427 RepID=UPI00187F4100|nr:PEP-CTERM sorting domain-containing protein [Phormidium sp. LEGE 05292]MBE9226399.1 PEP-CTERM sorting domain-containing protein [Phormidium sp. LEGE 05292]
MAILTTMSTKILNKLVLGVAVGAISLLAMKANPANAASVKFATKWDIYPWGSGSFTGLDNNLDNLLTLDELTSFIFSSPPTIADQYITLNDLKDFGSFNLNTGVWNADAAGWGNPTGSYFSTGNGFSAHTPYTIVMVDYAPPASATVPEPASILGFLGLGTLGIGSMLKRK